MILEKLTTDELENLYSLKSDRRAETIRYNRITAIWQNNCQRPVSPGPSEIALELERRGVERFQGYSDSWKS